MDALNAIENMHVVSVAGVVSMFGSTYNGQFEDVKAFNDKVGKSTAVSRATHLLSLA